MNYETDGYDQNQGKRFMNYYNTYKSSNGTESEYEELLKVKIILLDLVARK